MRTLSAITVLLGAILVLFNARFVMAVYDPATLHLSALSSILVGVTTLLGFQRLLRRAKGFERHGRGTSLNAPHYGT
ncbi:MAG TPA: hypothetical protein VGD78_05430 [Chthoniobacterales bacterium]